MTDNGISETISEKKKRGRPSVMTKEKRAFVKSTFPDVKTDRGIQNKMYELHALSVIRLCKDRNLTWLADFEKMRRGEIKAYKPAILAELGRILDTETIEEIAGYLCETKPKTKDAIVNLRRFRKTQKEGLGSLSSDKGNTSQLEDEISRAIDDYLLRHPDTPHQKVLTALNSVVEYAKVGLA